MIFKLQHALALVLTFGGEANTELDVTFGSEGHSGPGLYVSFPDYPDEGSIFIGRVEEAEGAAATEGVCAILLERFRQLNTEGWTPEHDDEHQSGELAAAAACYALAAVDPEGITPFEQLPVVWPWERGWYKPKNHRVALVKAGALIAAEIDRLGRARDKGEGPLA